MQQEINHHYLRKQARWENLWFYQKTVTLYDMTVVFCRRFLPAYGDRTVDQMIQAARSGKQNIVEGSADGVTSTEMEAKLLNVARASIKELLTTSAATSSRCGTNPIPDIPPCNTSARSTTRWRSTSHTLSDGLMKRWQTRRLHFVAWWTQ